MSWLEMRSSDISVARSFRKEGSEYRKHHDNYCETSAGEE